MEAKKETKNKKRITLIALVITIIVLLILAGVTIATLTGENGILTRAQDAKNETEQAEKDEKTNLSRTEDIINQYVNGIEVEQVTDTNPGVLEAEGTDTYVINSIEDLVVFASNVTKGTTYEGQTVKLGLSLDFNSSKSYVDPLRTDYAQYGYDGELKTLLTSGEGFKTIGINDNQQSEYSFNGIFDGSGNIIYNCYINISIENNQNAIRVGLFGNNYGAIKNIGMINCNINGLLKTTENKALMVGGLVGDNYGIIENCFSNGQVTANALENTQARCGGISGQNRNIIRNCYNSASINALGTNMNTSGGICGHSSIEGTILDNCYNFGVVKGNIQYVNNDNSAYIGGIVGMKEGNINYCYNIGTIELDGNATWSAVGGIAGRVKDGDVKNCYNNSTIITSQAAMTSSLVIGEIIGQLANSGKATNCAYKTGTQNSGIGIKSDGCIDETVELDDLPDILSIIGNQFKDDDTNNINNGYPILTWQ